MPNLPKDPCIKLMVEASNGKMSEKEASAILDHLRAFQQGRKKLPSGEDVIASLQKEATRLKHAKRADGFQKRAREIIDRGKRKERFDDAVARGTDLGQSVYDTNHGGLRQAEGSRDSVDYNSIALTHGHFQYMKEQMDKVDGAWDMFTSRKWDDKIIKDMATIGQENRPKTQGDHGKAIRAIGDAIHSLQERIRTRANRSGASIDATPGYLFKRSHDIVKMKRAGRAQWISDMKENFGTDATYRGADPDKFWNSAWEAQTTGIRLDGDTGGIRAGTNLAESLSKERVYHAVSPAHELAYLRKYGVGSLSEAIASNISTMSRAIALMEKWGTNPRSNFEKTISALEQHIREKFKGDDTKIEKALKSLHDPRLDRGMKILLGEMRGQGPTVASEISNIALLTQMMAKLGFAAKYGVTVDKASIALQLNAEGKSFHEAAYYSFRDAIMAMTGGDKETLKGLLAMSEGWQNEVATRFTAGDTVSGWTGKVAKFFSKMNLTYYLDKFNRAGFEYRLQNILGDEAAITFSALSKERQTRLAEFKIGETEWELLRKAIHKNDAGLSFMQPRMIREKVKASDITAPLEKQWKADKLASLKELKKNADATEADLAKQLDEAWTPASERIAQKKLDELETKLGTYLTDATDMAIIRPGTAERLFLQEGRFEGGGQGEMWRKMVVQFKSFPVAAARKMLARQAATGGVSGVAKTIASTVLMAYFTIALEDLYKNKDPSTRNWKDPVLLANAMAKSGGLGIYGDAIFGMAEISEGVLGPTLGPAFAGATGIRDKLRAGQPTKAADEFTRRFVGMVPGANFFATKAVMDYFVWHELYEWMNPGYKQRRKQRERREGQPEQLIGG